MGIGDINDAPKKLTVQGDISASGQYYGYMPFMFKASIDKDGHNDRNTYIDVGTTLHTYLKLDVQRDYLRAYHNNLPHPDLFSSCV